MSSRIDTFLEIARKQGASDIHFASGSAPLLRVLGELKPIRFRPLDAREVENLIDEILSPEQRRALAEHWNLDFAYTTENVGRFRANVFRKTSGLGATFRVTPTKVPSLLELELPAVVQTFAEARQGLVLVTGSAGSGKSTTLAAMVGYLNRSRKLNVITLEDPIEYIHESAESLVIQREVGTHVKDFAAGLKAALREDPDVILVGELRDLETISLAMVAAETGHLVLGTLHTTSAAKTLDRILDVMPAQQKGQAAIFLAQHLRGVVSQRLVRTPDGSRRKAIVEVLVNTPAIANLILNRKIFLIPDRIQTGSEQGMQRMDRALLEAVKHHEIDPNDAYLSAEDKRPFQSYVTDPSILPQVSMVGP